MSTDPAGLVEVQLQPGFHRGVIIAIYTDRKLSDDTMKELNRIFSNVVNRFSDPKKYRIFVSQMAIKQDKEWLKQKGLLGLKKDEFGK